MNERKKYIAQAEAWLGAELGDEKYTEMLNWFNKNPKGIKADTENCTEFNVACALKALGIDQKFIPVASTANAQAKLWKELSKEPQIGAVAYFDYKDGKGISHSEIVTDLTETEVKTINGNYNHKVKRVSRKRTYKYWAGFGIPDWPEEAVNMTEWQKAAAGQIVIKRGTAGSMVLWLQKYLKANGHYKAGTLDGICGAYMEQAIRDWQRAHGLYVDGIVGRNCWEYILKEA